MNRKPDRTQIPHRGGSGLTPTGAMQFANDSPGVFIRGDDTGPVVWAIRQLQQHCSGSENSEVLSALDILDKYATIILNDVIVRKDELDESLTTGRSAHPTNR